MAIKSTTLLIIRGNNSKLYENYYNITFSKCQITLTIIRDR